MLIYKKIIFIRNIIFTNFILYANIFFGNCLFDYFIYLPLKSKIYNEVYLRCIQKLFEAFPKYSAENWLSLMSDSRIGL